MEDCCIKNSENLSQSLLKSDIPLPGNQPKTLFQITFKHAAGILEKTLRRPLSTLLVPTKHSVGTHQAPYGYLQTSPGGQNALWELPKHTAGTFKNATEDPKLVLVTKLGRIMQKNVLE